MNTLLNDRDEDIDELQHRQSRPDRVQDRQRDREITLGTTMVLGIFFALAVLCAAFFGFGYSTGRHSALTAAGPAGAANANSNGILKPGAGSMFGPINNPPQNIQQQPIKTGPVPSYNTQPADQDAEASSAPPTRPAAVQRVVETTEAPAPAPVEQPKAARVLAVSTPVPVTASPAAVGQFMVQVAAVSHQEDADLLVTTLKRRSYGVAVHQEPQDKLLHVQVGPFTNKKDADAMRQRLLADGFNAIVK
ncbi:SPOR domain-containing protein [Granulicella tundricola]|uniref:Sporulation domain-containing protein n=1 Tax=Granulicella tundricola (strain ATCC BAA-1859 / DSM 23138 / MP5ACTX9) TaxID=1198114 RepID=E8WYD1_GRATM|nr:SPOR domain-containing protein [Granulicella tundricola]ADW69837.1 Sporulation domain-containing protein [Granulicella tundricola MP5ACTX9]